MKVIFTTCRLSCLFGIVSLHGHQLPSCDPNKISFDRKCPLKASQFALVSVREESFSFRLLAQSLFVLDHPLFSPLRLFETLEQASFNLIRIVLTNIQVKKQFSYFSLKIHFLLEIFYTIFALTRKAQQFSMPTFLSLFTR